MQDKDANCAYFKQYRFTPFRWFSAIYFGQFCTATKITNFRALQSYELNLGMLCFLFVFIQATSSYTHHVCINSKTFRIPEVFPELSFLSKGHYRVTFTYEVQ
jgi:hypothetical protein